MTTILQITKSTILYIRKMDVTSWEYNSCYQFFRCVLSFWFCYWLRGFPYIIFLRFRHFCSFTIFLQSVQNKTKRWCQIISLCPYIHLLWNTWSIVHIANSYFFSNKLCTLTVAMKSSNKLSCKIVMQPLDSNLWNRINEY